MIKYKEASMLLGSDISHHCGNRCSAWVIFQSEVQLRGWIKFGGMRREGGCRRLFSGSN
jgi:hypothetical protein